MENLLRTIAQYKQGQICKHLVLLEILSEIEKSGKVIDPKLVKACCDSDDEEIRLLLNI